MERVRLRPWIRKFKFAKMSLLPQTIYRFNSNPLKIPVGLFVCVWSVKS